MKRALSPSGINFIVTRERGGRHGVELVNPSTAEITIVPSLDGYIISHTERSIRPGDVSLSSRPDGWLRALRLARAEHIRSGIKSRKVDKSEKGSKPKGPRQPSTRKSSSKNAAIISAAQAEVEAKIAGLPPELQQKIRAAMKG